MNSLAQRQRAGTPTPPPEIRPDYFARALALYPRLEPARLARVRRDPNRVAALISHRTTLPVKSILALLGAPQEAEGAGRERQDRRTHGHGVDRGR
jgi:hypothetical protein